MAGLLEQNRYLELGEFLLDRLGRQALAQCVQDGLGTEPTELPAPHQLLPTIPFAGVVTTNYDRLLERAIPAAIVATQLDRDLLGAIVRGEELFVLKAHGDVARPETLVLAATDYRDQVHGNSPARESLRTLLNANTVLFIGYSISDPDFRLLLEEHAAVFGEYGAARYALIRGSTGAERLALRNAARVEVLQYDEHPEVLQFLEALRDAVRDGQSETIRAEPEPVVPPIDPRHGARDPVEPAVARTSAEFLEQFERASADETEATLLTTQPPEFEAALVAHLGQERLTRLREQARRRQQARSESTRLPTVVLIPGFLATELNAGTWLGKPRKVWLNLPRLLTGAFAELRYHPDRQTDVRATSVLMQSYGALVTKLAQHWDVRVFAYDWRRSFRDAASALHAFLERELDSSGQCHIVAHGTGGLVARAFLSTYPDAWRRLWDDRSEIPGTRGGRLVMLGTPNHGFFSTMLMLLGEQPLVQKVGALDLRHSVQEIASIFASFPAVFELFPSPVRDPAWHRFYDPSFFGNYVDVSGRMLESAYSFHEYVTEAVDIRRMACIVGTGEPTVCGYDGSTAAGRPVWISTDRGDGNTPVDLSILAAGDDIVPTWVANRAHGSLPSSDRVIAAIDEILRSGHTGVLPSHTAGAEIISPEEKLRWANLPATG